MKGLGDEHILSSAPLPTRNHQLLRLTILYLPLSYRDIQKMMLYRGIEVTYAAIRYGCRKFAQQYANAIRCRRPKPSDKWHLDEMVIKIKAKQYYR